jgi:hypothetical protein
MLENVSLKLRENAAELLKAILTYLEIHHEIILDCGCVTRIPNADIILVEMDNGLHLAVCPACEELATDEYNRGVVRGKYNC